MIGLSGNEVRKIYPYVDFGEYPLTTEQASFELCMRGYHCESSTLSYIVKKGHASPKAGHGGNLFWSESDVDAAAKELERMEKFRDSATIAKTFGVPYVDFAREQQKALDPFRGLLIKLSEPLDLFDVIFHATGTPGVRRVEYRLTQAGKRFIDSQREGGAQ